MIEASQLTPESFASLLQKVLPLVSDMESSTKDKELPFILRLDRIALSLLTLPNLLLGVLAEGQRVLHQEAQGIYAQLNVLHDALEDMRTRIEERRPVVSKDNEWLVREMVEAYETEQERSVPMSTRGSSVDPPLSRALRSGMQQDTTSFLRGASPKDWLARVVSEIQRLNRSIDRWGQGVLEFTGLMPFLPLIRRVQLGLEVRTNRLRLRTASSLSAQETREVTVEVAALQTLLRAVSPQPSVFTSPRVQSIDNCYLHYDALDARVSYPYALSSVGPYTLGYDTTLQVEVGGAPVNKTLRVSSPPSIWDTRSPAPVPTDLVLGVDICIGIGTSHAVVHTGVEIITPTVYLGTPPSLGNHPHGYVACSTFHESMVGSFVTLQYRGLLTSLTADQIAAVRANESNYRVVGYDGTQYSDPVIKLDPPLPSGYISAIAQDWMVSKQSHDVVQRAPANAGIYPTYLARLIDELNGTAALTPTDEKMRVIRLDTYVAGTVTGYFRVGERVLNTNGTVGVRHGIVLAQTVGGLYVLSSQNPIQVGDDLEGYETGATLTTVTAVTGQQSYPALDSGATNLRRWLLAEDVENRLRLRLRDEIGTGADATLDDGAGGTGTLLTIGLSDDGLYDMGCWPGSTVWLGNTAYVLDSIAHNREAIVTTPGFYTGAWAVRAAEDAYSLTARTGAYRANLMKNDVSTLIAAAPVSGYESSNYSVRHIYAMQYTRDAYLPSQTSTRADVAEVIVADEIRRQGISGADVEISSGHVVLRSQSVTSSVQVTGGTAQAVMSFVPYDATARLWEVRTGQGAVADLRALGVLVGDKVTLQTSSGGELEAVVEEVDHISGKITLGDVAVEASGKYRVQSIKSAFVEWWESVQAALRQGKKNIPDQAALTRHIAMIQSGLAALTGSTQLQLSDVNPALSSTTALLDYVTSLSVMLVAPPAQPTVVSSLLRGLEEDGMDRVARLLRLGDFDSVFFLTTWDTASTTGYIAQRLGQTARQAGVVQHDPEAETPVFADTSNLSEEGVDDLALDVTGGKDD